MKKLLRPAQLLFAPVFILLILVGGAQAQTDQEILNAPPPALPTPKPTPRPTPEPEPRAEDLDVVRVNSNLVVVPVSVTDGNGNPLTGLQMSDFRLTEDGKTQTLIALGNAEQVPLDIALLIDVSGSVSTRFEFEKAAAARFLRDVMKPGDRAAIYAIDQKPVFIAPLAASGVAAQAVMGIDAKHGFTAFFDSVLAAAKHLEKNSTAGRRRVVIVISDGEETASFLKALPMAANSKKTLTLDDLRMAQIAFAKRELQKVKSDVQKAEVAFYAINPSGEIMHLNVSAARAQEGLVELAQATGGNAFVPRDENALEGVFKQIASELRSQYLLQYYAVSDAPTGKYLKINVAVPTRSNTTVRARQGYYAKGD